jgi:hypothetical protein
LWRRRVAAAPAGPLPPPCHRLDNCATTIQTIDDRRLSLSTRAPHSTHSRPGYERLLRAAHGPCHVHVYLVSHNSHLCLLVSSRSRSMYYVSMFYVTVSSINGSTVATAKANGQGQLQLQQRHGVCLGTEQWPAAHPILAALRGNRVEQRGRFGVGENGIMK